MEDAKPSMDVTEPNSGAAPESAPQPKDRGSLLDSAMAIAKIAIASPAFVPAVVVAIGVGIIFLPLWPKLLDLWMAEDGYYSHGFLVPVIAGYITFRWWPWLSKIPVRPSWIALLPMAFVLYNSYISTYRLIEGLMSVCLIALLMCSVWLVAGWRWMLGTAAPILYLGFGLPLWRSVIDNYTNPLQLASTQVAFNFLKMFGFSAYLDENTRIMMNSYTLDVAVPCSGLKLVVALTAFTVFFVLIARLKVAANVVLLAGIIPLALMINGLRIALIGVVGELRGPDAAHTFHDYSGYITLLLCFWLLFKMCRLLGWKD